MFLYDLIQVSKTLQRNTNSDIDGVLAMGMQFVLVVQVVHISLIVNMFLLSLLHDTSSLSYCAGSWSL